jgi:hypothetical protein
MRRMQRVRRLTRRWGTRFALAALPVLTAAPLTASAAKYLIQEAPAEERDVLLGLLDEPTRNEVVALLAYAEDHAGGPMNPRFARVRADMSVDAAITCLRRQTREQVDAPARAEPARFRSGERFRSLSLPRWST